MSESYAALTLLSETPNAYAREMLSRIADGWDLHDAVEYTVLGADSWPHSEDHVAAFNAVWRVCEWVWPAD